MNSNAIILGSAKFVWHRA